METPRGTGVLVVVLIFILCVDLLEFEFEIAAFYSPTLFLTS
jgi:hypothetical protein